MAHGMPPVRVLTALLMFKPWVPHRLRFWSLMLFILFYQFTGGIYLSSISQIQGELAFWSEDVTMASYCSLIGLNIIFPALFRWKFYFYTRQMWFVASIGSLICAVAAYYCVIPWLFSGICLFAGYFKLMGMFGTVSNVQLNWTPTRSFGVFLPIIFMFVLGTLQLANIVSTYVAYYANWRLMYCVIVVMMVIVDAVVYFMMNPDHRSGPYVPLTGFDWIGHILWACVCISGAYIFNYGEHYEWWESREICMASLVCLVLLALAVMRMFRLGDKAFIVPQAFTYPVTWFLLLLLMCINVILGVAHYVQPIYINGVLGYDSLNANDLNWPHLSGIVIGAILAYWLIIRLGWSIRRYFFFNMLIFCAYAVTMYFICTPDTPKEYLAIPMFMLGIADVLIETGATYALSQKVPWQVFFMNITIIGFVRCGLGSAAGAGIVENMFAKFSQEYGVICAIRESYGVSAWIAVACIVLILATNFKSVPRKLLPKWSTVVRTLKLSHGV